MRGNILHAWEANSGKRPVCPPRSPTTAQRVSGFTYGNGVSASFGYSADRLQLTSLAYAKSSSTLFSLSYGCSSGQSNNGQITNITDNVDSGRTASYTYDPMSRLTAAGTSGSSGFPAWGLSFTYDRYGNRTAQTVTAGSAPSNSLSVDSTTNRLTNTGFSYDANGNMTNDGTNYLVYDAENHLLTSTGSGGTGGYLYDGNGLRVEKCVGNCSTATTYAKIIYSGGKPIAEDSTATGLTEYIYSGGALLATIDSSGTRYHHPDHLSPRVTTDSSGNVIGQQGHYPFGESWYAASTTNKYQFTSYERDSESGNDYAHARYDINRLGRFNSPDLLSGDTSDPQSLNRYAYVRNVPTGLIDPTGMFTANPCGAYSDRHKSDSTKGTDASGGPNDDSDSGEEQDFLGSCPAGPWPDPGIGGGGGGGIDMPADRVGCIISYQQGFTSYDDLNSCLGIGSSGEQQAKDGTGGGAGSRGPAFDQAKKILDNNRCLNFLIGVAEKAASTLQPGDAGAKTFEDDAIHALKGTLDTAPLVPRPTENPTSANGYNTIARADLNATPPTITLYKNFYNQEFLNQSAQTLIHEAVHINTGLSDQQLAQAATGKPFGPNQGNEASAAFHDKLTSKCY